MNVTFFLKLGTFFNNYFSKPGMLINTLAYELHFDILCINKLRDKLCQIGEYAYVYVNYDSKQQNNQQKYYQFMKKFTFIHSHPVYHPAEKI
jgi:hypothetical protein